MAPSYWLQEVPVVGTKHMVAKALALVQQSDRTSNNKEELALKDGRVAQVSVNTGRAPGKAAVAIRKNFLEY